MADFIVKLVLILVLIPNKIDAPPIKIRNVDPCQSDMLNTPCLLQNASTQWVSTGDNASVTWVFALPEEMAIGLYGALENISLTNFDVPIITGRLVSSKHGDWEGWHPDYNFSPQDGYHRLNINISLAKAELEHAYRFHFEFHVGDVTYKTSDVLLFNVTSKETYSTGLPDIQTAPQPNNSVSKPTSSPTDSCETSHSTSDCSQILARVDEHNSTLRTIKWMVLSMFLVLAILLIACVVDKWTTIKRKLNRIYSLLVNWILTPMQQCFGRLRQFWSPSSSSPTQSPPPSQLSSPSPRPPPNLPTSQPHPLRDNNVLEQEHQASTTNPNSTSILSDTKSNSKEAGNEETQEMTVPKGDGLFSSNSPTALDEGHGNQTQGEIHQPQNVQQKEQEKVVTASKDSKSTTVDLQDQGNRRQIRDEIDQPPNAEQTNQEQANVVKTTKDTKSPTVEDVTFQAPGADYGGEMDQHVDDKKVQGLVQPEEPDEQEKIAERESPLPNEQSHLLENNDGHAKSPD